MSYNFDPNNNILYVTNGGGCSTNAINVSTMSSIILASLGVRVIKHVNNDSLKKCSGALFLKELGIKIASNINEVEEQFLNSGIVFIESIKGSEVENLCPLIAPNAYTTRFIGANQIEKAMSYLFELRRKNYSKAVVVVPSNSDFDEVSICSSTQIFELRNEEISNYVINPEDFGICKAEPITLTGATPLYNKNLALDIFSKKIKGPKADVLALNSGVMLYSIGFTDTIKKGIIAAYEALESKKALCMLESLRS